MRIVYAALGRLDERIKELQKPIAKAATETMKEVAELVKTRARANIGAAGFSAGWQNAFRSQVFPKSGESINAAAYFWHKIPYFNVFEQGATIAGKPMLWLPLPTVPLNSRGGRPLTPEQYVNRIGPLASIRGAGGKPILVGKASRGSIAFASDRLVRLKKKAVRTGTIRGVNVPLYIGIDSVTIGKRFNVTEIVKEARDQLGQIYLKHITSGK